MKKERKIAITSILSWKQCIEEGLPVKERELVIQYLSQESTPKTSRQISYDLKIERTNITRTLYDLENMELVEVKLINKCLYTKRVVRHYGIKEKVKEER